MTEFFELEHIHSVDCGNSGLRDRVDLTRYAIRRGLTEAGYAAVIQLTAWGKQSRFRLSEQILRVDKWSLCRD